MIKFFKTQEDEDKIRISHSQFKKWRECPKKWGLRYREGIRPPDESILLVFGTAIHENLQDYLQKMYDDAAKGANRMDLKGRFNSLLKEEYDNRKEAFEEKHPDHEFPISKKEMVQFYRDGEQIIDYFRSNRSEYFPKRTMELVGIEEKIEKEVADGIVWVGYLDIVLRDRASGKYKIIDLKTSTDGWDKWKKKEKKRTDQLVAYKKFYAEQLGIEPDMVEIEYLIMKRELNTSAPYKPSRFQRFSPASGSQSRARVGRKIEEFISDAFNDNGEYREGDFEKKPDKYKCAFCPYSEDHGEEGYQICDQNGKRFMDYGENMRPYIDDKFIGPQPEQ